MNFHVPTRFQGQTRWLSPAAPLKPVTLCLFLLLLSAPRLSAQEHTTAIRHSSGEENTVPHSASRPTLLSLPFFEDFTQESLQPDPALWEAGGSVYLSNTMPVGHFSRGVAVFDACNAANVPYDTMDRGLLVQADTLTSLPIDLSGYSLADDLALSFHYQAKGNGFFPKPGDTLYVFMLQKNGQWKQVWERGGDTSETFRLAYLQLRDTLFFHSQFQLRFLNKATIGISNSNWVIDYILLDANRSIGSYRIDDVAFTTPPENLLSEFTAMPWRHFKTDPARFTAPQLNARLRNNGSQAGPISWGYSARETHSGTLLGSGSGSVNFSPEEEKTLSTPVFEFASFTPSGTGEAVEIRTSYYCNSLYPDEPIENDTITQVQHFDNYFAYDDGSAEQSYFLTTYPNAPGETAIEFAAYVPDTLRGVSIYFAPQVPPATYKEFSIAIYRELSINGGMDSLIYQQDYFFPRYSGEVNVPVNYVFESPVALGAGPFYVSIVQPAGGFSDSLYIGLDRNRTAGNYRYFNVGGSWQSSQIEGALLVRPLLGAPVPSGIKTSKPQQLDFRLFPNPAHTQLQLESPGLTGVLQYQVYDFRGRILQNGNWQPGQAIDIQGLPEGIYLLKLQDTSGRQGFSKWVKSGR